jgi:hypothetical protein
VQVEPIQIDQIRQCVLPIAATKGDASWVGLGTGFVVSVLANGRAALVMTAAHVLEEATKLDPYLQRRTLLPGLGPPASPSLGSTTIYALPYRAAPAKMHRCWWRSDSDIGLAVVEAAEAGSVPFSLQIPLDVTPHIELGADVLAWGYPDFHAHFVEPPDYEKQDIRVQIAAWNLQATVGKVIQNMLPHGMHRGIGVRICCSFPHGLSGAPLFRANEKVIARAVVSSAWKGEEAAGGTAALLTPALKIQATHLVVMSKTGNELKEPTVREMIEAGVILTAGLSPVASPDG